MLLTAILYLNFSLVYTIVFTKESIEVALGGSSIRLVYTYVVYKAIYTRVILDCNSRGYIGLVYALDIQFYIYLYLPLVRAAVVRAIVIISICRAYIIK